MSYRPYRGYREAHRLPPVEFWEELRADFRAVATALNELAERFGRVEERVNGIERSDLQKANTSRWVIGLLVMVALGVLGLGGTVLGVILAWMLGHLHFN